MNGSGEGPALRAAREADMEEDGKTGMETPAGLPGSDEFRKIDDPFGDVVEEGEFSSQAEAPHLEETRCAAASAASAAAPPAGLPARMGERAFVAATASVTLMLMAGVVGLYALSGGFDRPGARYAESSRDPPEAAPPPGAGLGAAPAGSAAPGAGREELLREIESLRLKIERLEAQKIGLQLEVRKWRLRAEEMDDSERDFALDRFLSKRGPEREEARAMLAARGGKMAAALLLSLEEFQKRTENLAREIREWSERHEAGVQALQGLSKRLAEVETRKVREEALEFYQRGAKQAAEGEYAKADASFTRAIELDPALDAAYNARGLVRRGRSAPDAALADFERACDLNPSSHVFHFNRGSALADLGRTMEAGKAFEKAIVLRPGYADAVKALRDLRGGDGSD